MLQTDRIFEFSDLLSATITLSADGTGATGAIVGSAANSLGHANGITVISATSGKRIQLIQAYCNYAFSGAAYTGGGNNILVYTTEVATQLSNAVAAATGFGRANNGKWLWIPAAHVLGSSGIGGGLAVRSSAAYTQPGSAAGTATLTVYYQLVDF